MHAARPNPEPAAKAQVISATFGRQRTLSPRQVNFFFYEFAADLDIEIPETIRHRFLARSYRSVACIRKAIQRYRVFGDLGYGS